MKNREDAIFSRNDKSITSRVYVCRERYHSLLKFYRKSTTKIRKNKGARSPSLLFVGKHNS